MKIIKQFRKTISLKINENGEIIVKAPYFVTKKSIENFIEKHRNWISEKKENILKNKKNFEVGEKFYFFGSLIPLFLNSSQDFGLEFNCEKKFYFSENCFFTNLKNSEEIKEAFIKFYKKEAKKYIIGRTNKIAEKLNLKFNKIRITSAKTRWGSCSSKKNLNFSWRLMFFEKNIIDYVIIHELSHLIEMNHSKNFWDLVRSYSEKIGIGDYRIMRKTLKKRGENLF